MAHNGASPTVVKMAAPAVGAEIGDPETTALALVVAGRVDQTVAASTSLLDYALRDFARLGVIAELATEKGDYRVMIQATLARYAIADRAGISSRPDAPMRGHIEAANVAVVGADFLKALSAQFLVVNSSSQADASNSARSDDTSQEDGGIL
jgi:hypothetical protein